MDVFSSQLGMIKCSEIRHFSMKFPSEGEFWHCHFAGSKMGASNQMFQAALGSENKKISKVRHSVPPTVVKPFRLNNSVHNHNIPSIISSMSSSEIPCLLFMMFLNWSSSIVPVFCGSNILQKGKIFFSSSKIRPNV